MDMADFCRFCHVNLRDENGTFANNTRIFDNKKQPCSAKWANEKSVNERLRALGLTLLKSPSMSYRMCMRCLRLLGRMEADFSVLWRWKKEEMERDTTNNTPATTATPTPASVPYLLYASVPNRATSIEIELELEDSGDEGSGERGGEKRKERDEEDTDVIPPKKMRLCRTVQDRIISARVDIYELMDQIEDVEGRYMQGLKDLKEMQEKYQKAMVSNTQLEKDKSSLLYQVDRLKDVVEEMEEQMSHMKREVEDTSKKHSLAIITEGTPNHQPLSSSGLMVSQKVSAQVLESADVGQLASHSL